MALFLHRPRLGTSRAGYTRSRHRTAPSPQPYFYHVWPVFDIFHRLLTASPITMKFCSRQLWCGISDEQPLSNFGLRKGKPRSECKICNCGSSRECRARRALAVRLLAHHVVRVGRGRTPPHSPAASTPALSPQTSAISAAYTTESAVPVIPVSSWATFDMAPASPTFPVLPIAPSGSLDFHAMF